MNPTFAVIYGILIALVAGTEIIGVIRKQRGDTITEGWHEIDRNFNGVGRWIWRILTIGFLGWLTLHFTTGMV